MPCVSGELPLLWPTGVAVLGTNVYFAVVEEIKPADVVEGHVVWVLSLWLGR